MEVNKAFLSQNSTVVGIWLGGGITNDSKLPDDVLTKVEKAYHLLKEKRVHVMILTGGASNPKKTKLTEAKLMLDVLLKKEIKKAGEGT